MITYCNNNCGLNFQRYFVLDKGILKYGKNPLDMSRGKIHGQVDIGLSVISTKYQRKRLDIDAEEFIYHLKVSFISYMFVFKVTYKAIPIYLIYFKNKYPYYISLVQVI